MNANPSACPHLNLTYDGTFAIVRCLDCDTTWDANTCDATASEAKPCASSTQIDTAWQQLADIANWLHNVIGDDEPPLNPDNEPTSEHEQWKRDNEHEDPA